MRTTDRPCGVSIDNGQVRFECGGAVALLPPAVASQVGRRLAERFPVRTDNPPPGVLADEPRGRIGRLLIDGAARALAPAEPLRAVA